MLQKQFHHYKKLGAVINMRDLINKKMGNHKEIDQTNLFEEYENSISTHHIHVSESEKVYTSKKKEIYKIVSLHFITRIKKSVKSSLF